MKMRDFLHKIGVFRSGSVSWRGDASKRPIEAIMDDVYDREKDLVRLNRGDGSTARAADKVNTVAESSRKGRFIHFLTLALGVFVLFIMAAGGYFGPWFWGNAAAWLVFTRYTKKSALQCPYATGKITGILLLLSLASFFSLSAVVADKTEQPVLSRLTPLSRVDLAIGLENDLRLEDVRVDVLDGGILEVRTKTPAKVSHPEHY